MSRTPLVAGNWKMHKNAGEAVNLVNEMMPGLSALKGVDSLICPPSTALMPVAAILEGSNIALGAQNLYWEVEGAYTGELSPMMIKDFCEYVIIGHSERRQYFHEDDQMVNKKVLAAMAVDLVPVLCVGESLEENESGRAAEVLSGQLNAALQNVAISHSKKLVVAYEPIWAIGTGKAATPEDIDLLLRNVVRPVLAGVLGEEITKGIRVLYGGSVKPDNAKSYIDKAEIDGALVGGASLNADSFLGIAKAAQK